MKKVISLTLIICCLFFITCCKKDKPERIRYPEDTQDYDATPVERIADKWWILDSVSVNGVDYTDTVLNIFGNYTFYLSSLEKMSYGTKYREGLIQFEKKNYMSKDTNFQGITGFQCLWGISENFGYMPLGNFLSMDSIYSYVPYYFYPISNGNTILWKINSLSNAILKIHTIKNNTTIINYFKKY